MTKVFPGLIEQWQDDEYRRRELEEKEHSELKSIAAEHPSEEVNGRMSTDELVDGLEGLERL